MAPPAVRVIWLVPEGLSAQPSTTPCGSGEEGPGEGWDGACVSASLVVERDGSDPLLAQALTPTRIYWNVVKEVLPLVKGMAHITGGGLENIPRINMGFGFAVDFLPSLDEIPPVFGELVKRSGLDGVDLYRTFNMGVGFVLVTEKARAMKVISRLNKFGEHAWIIGEIVRGKGVSIS